MAECVPVQVNRFHPQVATVRAAARVIRSGEVIAARTDTLYGLLADVRRQRSLRALFRLKERPETKPILVLVDSMRRVREIACDVPDVFDVVAKAFWPGPLTIVLTARPEHRGILTGGKSTVGIRWPRSPLVAALVRQSGCPLTGTSANLSGRAGATSVQDVRRQLGRRLPLLLDSGPVDRPQASTVLDLVSGQPRILRAGRISDAAIARVLRGSGHQS